MVYFPKLYLAKKGDVVGRLELLRDETVKIEYADAISV